MVERFISLQDPCPNCGNADRQYSLQKMKADLEKNEISIGCKCGHSQQTTERERAGLAEYVKTFDY